MMRKSFGSYDVFCNLDAVALLCTRTSSAIVVAEGCMRTRSNFDIYAVKRGGLLLEIIDSVVNFTDRIG
jgi:hypothetical protein